MPIGWSGYPNGQIPLDKMTQLSPVLGVSGYAQTDAANAFLRMAKDFQAAVGIPLKFSEFYRPITIQEELFTDRYVRTSVNTGIYWQGSYWAKKPGVAAAAVPGTSNHGYAIAVDFAWPLTSWTTEGQQWFRANEARYDFSSAQGVADGEPWHKVYTGPTTTTSGGGATPIQAPKGRMDMLLIMCDLRGQWLVGPNYRHHLNGAESTALYGAFDKLGLVVNYGVATSDFDAAMLAFTQVSAPPA